MAPLLLSENDGLTKTKRTYCDVVCRMIVGGGEHPSAIVAVLMPSGLRLPHAHVGHNDLEERFPEIHANTQSFGTIENMETIPAPEATVIEQSLWRIPDHNSFEDWASTVPSCTARLI